MNVTGKAGSGVLGLVAGIAIALVGGGSLEDLIARVKGEEPIKTVAIRLVKKLCATPEAVRIGELASINDKLAEEDKSLPMPACDAEELASGPVDAEEVEETAAAVEDAAEAKAEEDAEAVEAEVAEVVEEEADHTDEIDPLNTVIDEVADTVKEATQ